MNTTLVADRIALRVGNYSIKFMVSFSSSFSRSVRFTDNNDVINALTWSIHSGSELIISGCIEIDQSKETLILVVILGKSFCKTTLKLYTMRMFG